jgi:hypothetical protein
LTENEFGYILLDFPPKLIWSPCLGYILLDFFPKNLVTLFGLHLRDFSPKNHRVTLFAQFCFSKSSGHPVRARQKHSAPLNV